MESPPRRLGRALDATEFMGFSPSPVMSLRSAFHGALSMTGRKDTEAAGVLEPRIESSVRKEGGRVSGWHWRAIPAGAAGRLGWRMRVLEANAGPWQRGGMSEQGRP
jgi:hypothetical protein